MNITGGKFNGRVIKAPDANLARPTLSKIRMAVVNSLYSLLGDFEEKSFLDVYSGSGIMGLEALSRGFEKAVGIEKNRTVLDLVKSNYNALNLTPNLIYGDSLKILKRFKDDYFDVIYIDPPYLSGIYEKTFELLPNFEIGVVEHSEDVDFSNFKIIQTKDYGGKKITYIKKADA